MRPVRLPNGLRPQTSPETSEEGGQRPAQKGPASLHDFLSFLFFVFLLCVLFFFFSLLYAFARATSTPEHVLSQIKHPCKVKGPFGDQTVSATGLCKRSSTARMSVRPWVRSSRTIERCNQHACSFYGNVSTQSYYRWLRWQPALRRASALGIQARLCTTRAPNVGLPAESMPLCAEGVPRYAYECMGLLLKMPIESPC